MSYPTGDAFTPKILHLKNLHLENTPKKKLAYLGGNNPHISRHTIINRVYFSTFAATVRHFTPNANACALTESERQTTRLLAFAREPLDDNCHHQCYCNLKNPLITKPKQVYNPGFAYVSSKHEQL
jgi:hypothetical protein